MLVEDMQRRALSEDMVDDCVYLTLHVDRGNVREAQDANSLEDMPLPVVREEGNAEDLAAVQCVDKSI